MANQITVESEAPQSMDEYNREMSSKATFAENTIDQGVVPLEDPEVVDETFRPEKFQSDEEWRKSYDELERNFHSPSSPSEQEQEEQSELSIPESTQDSPFDMALLQKEYMETGGLKDASYKLLEDAGISKEYANTYIAGVKALGEQIGNQVKDSVGGSGDYQNMVEWAQANYSPEQIQAYDNAVNSGDVQLAKLTARGLQADYQNSSGYEGQTVSGDTSLRMSDSSDVFRSNAQVTEAMKDPRYETDMAYRQDVRDKLERSEVFSLGAT
jgi:hypothetical protein